MREFWPMWIPSRDATLVLVDMVALCHHVTTKILIIFGSKKLSKIRQNHRENGFCFIFNSFSGRGGLLNRSGAHQQLYV
jgi:hypothetical protein